MDGEPVWLCSVSHGGPRGIIGTGDWGPAEFALAERLAHSALKGVGDPGRERAFRMNITFCIHRAVSAAEKASLPACWAGAPGALAGGPVEVLWSRGIPHRAAAMPCEKPTRLVIDRSRPDLWLPTDCQKCSPCLARLAIERTINDCRIAEAVP
jgi:hypothetical protein